MSSSSKIQVTIPITPHMAVHAKSSSLDKPVRTRLRRTSSLGADPRGDTGGNSIATSNLRQPTPPSPPPQQSIHPHTKERGRKRRKAKRFLGRTKRLISKHTWLLPLVLTLAILALYLVSPGEHNPLHAAIFLSYANPPLNERTDTLPPHIGNVTQYGKGPKDFAFVAFYTIVLSFTREFLMQRMIRPLAIRCGMKGRARQSRFMEQFYTAIYFAIFAPFGLYVMSRTPVWYFNTAGMYEGFPHRAHEACFKAYYLLQACYWAQQGLVLLLQLEAPRKDFRELVLHHIVTLSLIGLSYRFHFTYMGVAVYVTHDISDFFLATSKLLNYLDSPVTPPYFILFMLAWAYTRHFLNLRILYSLFPYDLPFLGPSNDFATVGPYTLNWETQQYKCWISQAITFGLIAVLQAINLFWFFLIGRIFVRFAMRERLGDERSEDEDDGGEDEVMEEDSLGKVGEQKAALLEEEEREKGGVGAGRPRVMINGLPISPIDENSASTSGMVESASQVEQRRATLRKR